MIERLLYAWAGFSFGYCVAKGDIEWAVINGMCVLGMLLFWKLAK